jgi:hypothetical protein
MTDEGKPFAIALKAALRRGYTGAVMLLGLTGTAALLYTTLIAGPSAEAGAELVRFFSYFTIQSTLSVTVWCAIATFRKPSAPRSDGGNKGAAVHLALLVSSILTAGGYYALLDASWKPQGLSAFGNLLAHAIVPALFVLDWLVFERKGRFRIRFVPATLVLPSFHIVVAVLVGSITARYPYYFLDPVLLGVAVFLRNTGLFAVLFVLTGGLLCLADRLMNRTGAKIGGESTT